MLGDCMALRFYLVKHRAIIITNTNKMMKYPIEVPMTIPTYPAFVMIY
jgi:hypothetical protein